MSGATEKTEALSTLLHKTITISNTYSKGCEENIVNEISDSVKVSRTPLACSFEDWGICQVAYHLIPL